jgi:hypothetical protein
MQNPSMPAINFRKLPKHSSTAAMQQRQMHFRVIVDKQRQITSVGDRERMWKLGHPGILYRFVHRLKAL